MKVIDWLLSKLPTWAMLSIIRVFYPRLWWILSNCEAITQDGKTLLTWPRVGHFVIDEKGIRML